MLVDSHCHLDLLDLAPWNGQLPFDQQLRWPVIILIGGNRGEKITRVGETVGANGSALG